MVYRLHIQDKSGCTLRTLVQLQVLIQKYGFNRTSFLGKVKQYFWISAPTWKHNKKNIEDGIQVAYRTQKWVHSAHPCAITSTYPKIWV